MVPECTHILPNGRKCAQFALRGQPFCSPHMDPERRRRSEELLALVDSIAEMDLEALLDAMIGITSERLQRQIPHAHFDTACIAALDRLQALKAESARQARLSSCSSNICRRAEQNQTLAGADSLT